MTSEVAAIILARAGSKGVAGKNTRPVAGRACIEWTLDAALVSERVGTVVVSSDDAEALAIARRRGVGTVERPPELAHDTATIDAAARHAVMAHPDLSAAPVFVLLYANVPVRPLGLIDRAVERLMETDADSVQSYAPVGKHHPWWTARLDDDGAVRPWEGEVLNHGVYRRQDLPRAVIPDGGVIALTRRALLLEIAGVPDGPHAFFGLRRCGVMTGEGEVVDIDRETDLLVADAILRSARGPSRPTVPSDGVTA